MKYFEDKTFILIWLGLFCVTALVFILYRQDEKNYRRHKAECMADGHKEYECVSILKSGRTTTFVPVVVR